MDFASVPLKLALRWELAVRAVLSLLAPLAFGLWLGDLTGGLVAAILAASVSISYLGPDLGFVGWSALAAVGSAAATVLGVWISGTLWLEIPFLLILFSLLGVAMLAGLISQLAVTAIAMTGLLAVSLVGGPLTLGLTVAIVLGAAWGLALILLVPRWSGWPRIPIDRKLIVPNAAILRRLLGHPSVRDWAFPVLLGALVVVAMVIATTVADTSRGYWAAIALVAVLGPSRQETLAQAAQFMAAAFTGVVAALLLLSLPVATGLVLIMALVAAALGALLVLVRPMLSKACFAFLVVTLITSLTAGDAAAVGGERFTASAVGVTVGILAAGLAQYLAADMEQRALESEKVRSEGAKSEKAA